MRELGTIVKLQVQVESLKIGTPPRCRYDPAGIREVTTLDLSRDGVGSWAEDGSPLSDVHHRSHPLSKNRAGTNGISIGFTTHYDLMRHRFGQHVVDGIAGENILVKLTGGDEIFTEDAFSQGITVRRADGSEFTITDVIVAPPCAEFSRWALRFPDQERPDRTVTGAIQFLHQGVRGFYGSYAGQPVQVTLGDLVFAGT